MGPSARQSRFPSEQNILLAIGQKDLEPKRFQKVSKFQIISRHFQKNSIFWRNSKYFEKKSETFYDSGDSDGRESSRCLTRALAFQDSSAQEGRPASGTSDRDSRPLQLAWGDTHPILGPGPDRTVAIPYWLFDRSRPIPTLIGPAQFPLLFLQSVDNLMTNLLIASSIASASGMSKNSSYSGGTSGSPCSCSESDPWEGGTISRRTA